jgi:cytohesin
MLTFTVLITGGRIKSWKRRWFILNDNCLYYFEYTTDKEPRGIIPLENIQVREAQDRQKHHCFELHASGTEFIKACKTDSEGKVVEGESQSKTMKIYCNIALSQNICNTFMC